MCFLVLNTLLTPANWRRFKSAYFFCFLSRKVPSALNLSSLRLVLHSNPPTREKGIEDQPPFISDPRRSEHRFYFYHNEDLPKHGLPIWDCTRIEPISRTYPRPFINSDSINCTYTILIWVGLFTSNISKLPNTFSANSFNSCPVFARKIFLSWNLPPTLQLI